MNHGYDLYIYKAQLVSVYDGDTITIHIDQGLCDWRHDQKCRLYGINTPEMRGPSKLAGRAARDVLCDQILREWGEGRTSIDGLPIMIRTHKDKTGKYGRWLVEILPRDPEAYGHDSINAWMVANGHAVPYLP